jgi:hypothetical protein
LTNLECQRLDFFPWKKNSYWINCFNVFLLQNCFRIIWNSIKLGLNRIPQPLENNFKILRFPKVTLGLTRHLKCLRG